MDFSALEHHGGADTVTGSCHRLSLGGGASLLIDCGSFQGKDAGIRSIDFPLDGVIALIVTHVHIDHVGRIPWLLAAGYQGPIICSEASAQLLPIVLEDTMRLDLSSDRALIDAYLDQIRQRLVPLAFEQWYDDATLGLQTEGTRWALRLQRAGHVLGSAWLEIDVTPPEAPTRRAVFSGDLGTAGSPFLTAPHPPERADLLVLESTYGDRRQRHSSERRKRLAEALEHALSNGGTVLVPAFSLGRTQELIFDLEAILHQRGATAIPPSDAEAEALASVIGGIDWPALPIILDSPLAARFTQVYRRMHERWNDEARALLASGRNPLAFDNLLAVEDHDAHLRLVHHLARTRRPAVVIAGSGMCSGGRIVNYLRQMLSDPRHDVLFVGFQAEGTPGKDIQRFGPRGGYVLLDGERIDIRARVETIEGYSAHADRDGLIEFATGMQSTPSHVRLVHGEHQARRALAQGLEQAYAERGDEVLVKWQ
ncbi:MBL fold hydrolase [Halotalea alkalilenta]|uniref:MBL fold hydrolase n=1 Tax=Halotalea alkalilenta TaxID=376489 RepID=A0A172YGM2_9GAMM|nr:MBL fold hydrolase [Halotalea alkalilenta]